MHEHVHMNTHTHTHIPVDVTYMKERNEEKWGRGRKGIKDT